VKRRDVHSNLVRDVPRSQPLEAMLRDLVERSADQLLTALFGDGALSSSRLLHAG
jgi:hypothetical protein